MKLFEKVGIASGGEAAGASWIVLVAIALIVIYAAYNAGQNTQMRRA